MEIKYLGHASFLLKTKTAKIITDPFDPKATGLKFPKEDADIVTVSHTHADHNAVSQVGGNPLVLDWPGEYEKNGARIFGYKTFHDAKQGAERGENIVFKFEMEGLGILHCGDLGHVPSEKLIERLGEIHILMIPVGGFYTVSAAEASQIISKIEPAIVIPMHFNRPELKQETYQNLTPLSTFLSEMGVENVAPEKKLTITRDQIGEDMRIVVLES